ncbi:MULTISPECIES: hypothetical protein [Rhodomicrobium]|uniref:hypothetical protein n=1 Tax=Rhodomicrobium TaxID=1068 RepID=UPI000B4BFD04|nr:MULTISPECIES: hypothetical protein [Rhodomicrobium]
MYHESGRKIRFGIAWEAVRYPFANIFGLLRLTLLPALISAALLYAAYRLFGSPISLQVETPEDIERFAKAIVPLTMPFWALCLFVSVIMAVGIHRHILRGEGLEWTLVPIRGYELAYAAVAGLFTAATFIEQYLFHLVAGWFGIVTPPPLGGSGFTAAQYDIVQFVKDASPALIATVALLTAVLIWAHVRLALVFPHAAVTGRISLSESWAAMRGNVWRFVVAALLMSILVFVVYLLTVLAVAVLGFVAVTLKALLAMTPQIPYAPDVVPVSVSVFTIILFLLSNWLLIGMIVAFVSFIYQDLVDGSAPVPQRPASGLFAGIGS